MEEVKMADITTNSEIPVQSPKKNFSRIAILLVVVLLIPLGVYARMQLGKSQIKVWVEPPLTSQPIEIPNETANWKYYRNEKYGFEFKYPQNWEINRTLGSPPELSDKQLSQLGYVSIFDPQTTAVDNGDVISFSADWGYPDPLSGKVRLVPITCTDITSTTCLEQIFSGGIPKYTKDIIATYPAIRGDISNIYILNKNKIFFINLSVGNEGRKKQATEVFDQILSTFKFTDLNQTKFICPQNGWVNCMPILTEEAKLACSSEAEAWYKINCPDFKGFAQ